MTVVDTDRIEMAEQSDERTLDEMFEWLEKMPVPEGIKVEIVGGNIFMSPQRDVHWDIIADIYDAAANQVPAEAPKSDVRIDFPGHLNGFATDVPALAEDALKDHKGHWRHGHRVRRRGDLQEHRRQRLRAEEEHIRRRRCPRLPDRRPLPGQVPPLPGPTRTGSTAAS